MALSDRRRRRIMAREAKRAAIEAAPQQLASDMAAAQAQEAYDTAVGGAEGMNAMAQESIGVAIQEAKQLLRGRDRREALRELTAQRGDAAAAVPFHQRAAASDLRSAQQGAAIAQAQDAAQLQADTRIAQMDALQEARQAKNARMLEQGLEQEEVRAEWEEDQAGLQAAASAVERYLEQRDADTPQGKKLSKTPLENEGDWLLLANELSKTFGGGETMRDNIMEVARRRMALERSPLGPNGSAWGIGN